MNQSKSANRFKSVPVMILLCFLLPLTAAGEDNAASPPPATFTAEQADRGETVYRENCVECHGRSLDNGQFGPPIKGSFFQSRWRGKSMDELFTLMETTMPPTNAGGFADETYADLMAYLLEANGVAAGEKALPSDDDSLHALGIPW